MKTYNENNSKYLQKFPNKINLLIYSLKNNDAEKKGLFLLMREMCLVTRTQYIK